MPEPAETPKTVMCRVIGDRPVNRVSKGGTIELTEAVAAQFVAAKLVEIIEVVEDETPSTPQAAPAVEDKTPATASTKPAGKKVEPPEITVP